MLRIRLFGPASATYCDRPLVGFPNHEAGKLLCFLLLHRAYPHHRERLAAVFWGDYTGEAALKCLRNTLWRLRKMFQMAGAAADDYVFAGDGSISFIRTSKYWLDVEAFEAAMSDSRETPGHTLSTRQANSLEYALDLYKGDLLEDNYEDWCQCEREHLRICYLELLNKLMVHYGSQGSYTRALEYGNRILTCDNMREDTHRRMMQLYWLAGNQCAALSQYKRCAQILHEELGVRPMEATTRLYRQIQVGNLTPSDRLFEETDLQDVRHHSDAPLALRLSQTIERLLNLETALAEARSELHRIEELMAKAAPNELSQAAHS